MASSWIVSGNDDDSYILEVDRRFQLLSCPCLAGKPNKKGVDRTGTQRAFIKEFYEGPVIDERQKG